MAEPGFFEVVRRQRGIRYYKPDPVPQEAIEQILNVAIRAPSGSNKQPWRFVVVRDRATKRRLGELYREGQKRSRGVMPPGPEPGSLATFSQDMENVPVVIMGCMLNEGATQEREILRGSSIYPALQNLMLAATALGLGTRITTMWHHCYKETLDLLGIPEDVEVVALIPLGYPQEPDHLGGSKRRPITEVAYYDKWGQTTPTA